MQVLADHLRSMLGPTVGIGVSDPRDAATGLFPAEEAAMTRAIPARRASFAAGRRAARQAMAHLGNAPAAIAKGPQGAPLWPTGLTGAITHCDTACLAAVMRSDGRATLGIDLEPATPLDPDLIPIICNPTDLLWVNAQADPGRAAKQVFCAKEALYKAQFPLTGRVIGFDAVSLTWDGPAFTATPPAGPTMTGRCVTTHGFILTTCQPQTVPA